MVLKKVCLLGRRRPQEILTLVHVHVTLPLLGIRIPHLVSFLSSGLGLG